MKNSKYGSELRTLIPSVVFVNTKTDIEPKYRLRKPENGIPGHFLTPANVYEKYGIDIVPNSFNSILYAPSDAYRAMDLTDKLQSKYKEILNDCYLGSLIDFYSKLPDIKNIGFLPEKTLLEAQNERDSSERMIPGNFFRTAHLFLLRASKDYNDNSFFDMQNAIKLYRTASRIELQKAKNARHTNQFPTLKNMYFYNVQKEREFSRSVPLFVDVLRGLE